MNVDVMTLLQQIEGNEKLQTLYGINSPETWGTVKLVFGYDDFHGRGTCQVQNAAQVEDDGLSHAIDAGLEDEAVAHLRMIASQEAAAMIVSGTWSA